MWRDERLKFPHLWHLFWMIMGILPAWWETENPCRKKKSVASLKDVIVHLNLHSCSFKSHLRCCSFFLSWLISLTQFSKKELLFSELCQRHPRTGCPATLLYVCKFLCLLCGLALCCVFHLEIVSDAPTSLEGKLAKQHPCSGQSREPGRRVASVSWNLRM